MKTNLVDIGLKDTEGNPALVWDGVPSELAASEPPAHQARCAVRTGSVSAFGRSRQNVRCACGHANSFYLWSWAGHGKAKCHGCGKFICYRTLEVFTDPEQLSWRKRIREADSQNNEVCRGSAAKTKHHE